MRHPDKGCWGGSRKLDHLGVHLNTEGMKVYIAEKKVEKVRALSKKILLLAQRNRRLVSLDLLRHFCGVCVSLTLALPLARFYTRSLYFDMALAEREERGPSPQRRGGRPSVSEGGRSDAKDLAHSDAARSQGQGGVWGRSPQRKMGAFSRRGARRPG